jgi:hypothetical protein
MLLLLQKPAAYAAVGELAEAAAGELATLSGGDFVAFFLSLPGSWQSVAAAC